MVKTEERDTFLSQLTQMQEYHEKNWDIKDYEIFEGTDQPNLFVEEFHVENEDSYREIKEMRLRGGDVLWQRIHKCIEGGQEKVNIWAFKKVN